MSGDFYDRARPKVARLAAELVEEDGLTRAEVANALLAFAAWLGSAAGGPEQAAEVLRSMADQVEAIARHEAPPQPTVN